MASTLSLSPNPPIPLVPQTTQFKSQNLYPLTRSLISFDSDKKRNQIELSRRKHLRCVSTPKQEVDVVGKGEKGRDIEYLVREFGWGVRKLYRVGEEVRMAGYVQAEAFYEPEAIFNGFFYEFFKEEKSRNCASQRMRYIVASMEVALRSYEDDIGARIVLESGIQSHVKRSPLVDMARHEMPCFDD